VLLEEGLTIAITLAEMFEIRPWRESGWPKAAHLRWTVPVNNPDQPLDRFRLQIKRTIFPDCSEKPPDHKFGNVLRIGNQKRTL